MPEYKIVYFNGRGRAEISRLIFTAAGEKFIDERIADWPKGKEDAPLGQLPYLVVDGKKFPQSIAIARFLAKRFKLAGVDELEHLKADAVVDTCGDFQTAFYTKVMFGNKSAEEKEAAKKTFFADEVPGHLAKIEKLVTTYGLNGHTVGKALTWADLAVFNIVDTLKVDIDAYPGVKAVVKSVEANDKIAAYVKSRPETPF